MARIAGVDIPRDKRVEVALTYIYGIGPTRARTILSNTGVNPDTRVKDLEDGDVQKLRGATEASVAPRSFCTSPSSRSLTRVSGLTPVLERMVRARVGPIP